MKTMSDNIAKNDEDPWGWRGPLVAVQGFGFLPKKVNAELDKMTQDVANVSGITMSDLSVATMDHFKCTILNDSWQNFYPHLIDENSETVCHPLWDGASCVPPTIAGEATSFPCMTMYNNKLYSAKYNATRECLADGFWNNLTDYTMCKELCLEVDAMNQTMYSECDVEKDTDLDISLHVYFAGYTISLVALLTTLGIFLSFRELRCLRHKIHMGLFLTLILSDMSWIFTALIQNFIKTEHYESVINIWCISQVVLRYFHLTTFFWMFLEGLYLFLQVQLPLSLATIRHLHFLIIGWGCPAVNMLVWGGIRLWENGDTDTDDTTEDGVEMTRDEQVVSLVMSCPFLQESDTDFFAYKLPVFILLLVNSFFLVWIMVIVVSKLRSRTALDHDRRHYKAAKALVIVIPLLGFTYLLTLMGPSEEESFLAFTIFQSVRAALLSTQGAVITLPYCFLNTEVQGVVKLHWERWKMVRNVGFECQSTGTSLAHSAVYYAQDSGNSPQLKTAAPKHDSKFLAVPAPLSKNSSKGNVCSEMCQPLTDGIGVCDSEY